MASCLLNCELVDISQKLYRMTWWATALNQISVPGNMTMCGGSRAIITDSSGVKTYFYNESTSAWKLYEASTDVSALKTRVSAVEENVDSLIQAKPNYDTVVTNVGTAFNNQYVSVHASTNKVITSPATIHSLAVVNSVSGSIQNIFIITRITGGSIRITKILDSSNMDMTASGDNITIANTSTSYTAHVNFINLTNKFTI